MPLPPAADALHSGGGGVVILSHVHKPRVVQHVIDSVQERCAVRLAQKVVDIDPPQAAPWAATPARCS